MVFFDNLTTSLTQKWLQFFQVNRSWIMRHMEVESVYTPDGGRRPSSYLILGVVNALEPQLAELMLPFAKLNPDVDTLIDVLELNFDPDLMLGNRFNPQVLLEELDDDDTVPNLLIEIDSNELSDMSLNDLADEVVLLETDDESFGVLSVDEVTTLSDISLDETADEAVSTATDDESMEFSANDSNTFGNMSIDELASVMGLEQADHEYHQTPSAAQQDESGDLLADVWNETTSSEPEQTTDETNSGTKKQPEQDSEISRLFPNF